MCPNWCCAIVKVRGKPEDIENFCKLFLFDEDVGNQNITKKYFARSFIYEKWGDFKKELSGKGEVEFSVDFAWSCWSCVFEGYPEQYKKSGAVTLEWAIKEYKVGVEIKTEEGGMAFEEHITTKNGKPVYESFEMPEQVCMACGSKQSIPSSYELDEEECSNCGNIGKWKDELTELMKEKLEKIKEAKQNGLHN